MRTPKAHADGDQMQDSIHPKQLTGARRARVLAVATLVSGVLVAGCGGSSPSPTASASSTASGSATTPGSSTATGAGATSSGSTAPGAGGSGPLAFAKCMRANGVPNFPDPNPGRGGLFSLRWNQPLIARVQGGAGEVPEAHGRRPPRPRLDDAPLRTDAGEAASRSRVHAPARRPPVPRPQDDSVPSNPAGIRGDHRFRRSDPSVPEPRSNLQAPAYKQALTACGAPPLGLPH